MFSFQRHIIAHSAERLSMKQPTMHELHKQSDNYLHSQRLASLRIGRTSFSSKYHVLQL